MSYDDYTSAPSGSFERSSSIDYSNHNTEYETQTTGPGFSSVGIKEPEYHYPTDGQRSVNPVEVVVSPPPQSDEVRPGVNSSNLLSNDTRNRGLDPYGYDDKPYSRGDLVHKHVSGYDVGDVASEEAAPSHSLLAQRERSNNGTATAAPDSVDPLDYVGISLVGRRFKMVNPEAYYVEKDDDPAPY